MQRYTNPSQSAMDLAKRPPTAMSGNTTRRINPPTSLPLTPRPDPSPHSVEGILRNMNRQNGGFVQKRYLSPSPGALRIMEQQRAAAAAARNPGVNLPGHLMMQQAMYNRPRPVQPNNTAHDDMGLVTLESTTKDFRHPVPPPPFPGQVRVRTKFLKKASTPSACIINSVYNTDSAGTSSGIRIQNNRNFVPIQAQNSSRFGSGPANGLGQNGTRLGFGHGNGFSHQSPFQNEPNTFQHSQLPDNGFQNGPNSFRLQQPDSGYCFQNDANSFIRSQLPDNGNGFQNGPNSFIRSQQPDSGNGFQNGPNSFVRSQMPAHNGKGNGFQPGSQRLNQNKQHFQKKVHVGPPITGSWKDLNVSKEDLDDDLDAYMAKATGGLSKIPKLGWCEKAKSDDTDYMDFGNDTLDDDSLLLDDD